LIELQFFEASLDSCHLTVIYIYCELIISLPLALIIIGMASRTGEYVEIIGRFNVGAPSEMFIMIVR